MTLPNKVTQFSADSDTVNSWLNGPATGPGATIVTAGGILRTPLKLIADKDADINAAAGAVLARAVDASVVATTAQATATAQAGIAKAQADIATVDSVTATTQAGLASKAASTAVASAATAMDQATTSTAQAVIAKSAADAVGISLGYQVPVAYVAGFSVTLANQTVSYLGQTYAPILSAIPFTTSGTFETAKFRLIQGVTSLDLAASTGAASVGRIAAGTGAIASTVEAKLRERVSVNDKWIVATDATVAMQNAVNESREVRFIAGFTYNLTGDVQIPSNTKIIVEKGATVINTGGRFTAYNVNDVEWRIDGVLRSVAMTTAPAKTGWPNTLAGTQNGDERGFLEFGGSDMASASVSGFKVHGSGKIIGDWVGTPNFDDSIRQVNRKGIAGWNCKNMTVQDINISGFEGEQVYAYINTPDCTNIKFDMVNSHHCRFNALNFNVSNVTYAGAYRGLSITDCVTDTSYAGIETSAGVITGNYCRAATNFGIWFGAGAGRGPIDISKNTVEDCALQSYALSFSSSLVTPVKDVTITGNKAINSGTDAFAFNKLQGFSVTGNTSRGHAAISAGKSFSFTNCTEGWVDGNITFAPGAFSTGNLTSLTSIINQGSNPVVLAAGTAVTANGTHYGFGGKFAAATTYGGRENQWAAWSSDFGAIGAGAEYVFKNGSGGNSIYAAISGKGGTYDAAGSIGGVVIATKKANTSQMLPTATAQFDELGNTLLFGTLTTPDIYAIRNTGNLANGAGGAAATLTNAPSAGSPTKWIAIKDGAVDRYVPSWTF